MPSPEQIIAKFIIILAIILTLMFVLPFTFLLDENKVGFTRGNKSQKIDETP